MYGIILSALWSALTWLFRAVVVKFLVFSVLFLVVSEVIPLVIGVFLPSGDGGLAAAFSGLPSGVWWMLDLFRLDIGAPALVSAWAGRFIIRRLPFVG